ncbi:hypothetical protein Lfu02_02060 [Longispora fulva]|nr:hypothetical protein Lfu02_02060 [Longispora fulva]
MPRRLIGRLTDLVFGGHDHVPSLDFSDIYHALVRSMTISAVLPPRQGVLRVVSSSAAATTIGQLPLWAGGDESRASLLRTSPDLAAEPHCALPKVLTDKGDPEFVSR